MNGGMKKERRRRPRLQQAICCETQWRPGEIGGPAALVMFLLWPT